MTPDLNFKHPANVKDPFPLFAWLRENDPVHWNDSLRAWVVTRYEDVMHILQNPLQFSSDRFRNSGEAFVSKRPAVQDVARVLRDWMVLRDPPNHTRLRALLNNSFTPGRLERMRPRIQAIVDDLFEQVAERGRMEFIEEFAFPLPATVIASMMGVPNEDIDNLKKWSDQLGAFLGGAQTELDNMEQARIGTVQLADYFRDLIGEHRRKPQDDLIGLMLDAQQEGDVLSEDEMVANSVLLLFAGHETTTNLLGNGLFHMLRHPEQQRLLARNPTLAKSAVEEFLRFDASVPAVLKVAREEIEFHGRRIAQGDVVLAFLSSANRDPAKFPQPDVLDIKRKNNRHLSFAFGIHFCLGAPLARLEARITFESIYRHFGGMTLVDEDPPWLPQLFLRGLQSLPISFHSLGSARAVSG